MIKKVLEYVKKYHMIESGDTIVAGVSGGADSVCLLFMLAEMQKQISFSVEVVHVNHKVRPDAAQDACFVRELCAKQGIAFHLVEENVKERAKECGISEEEAGRAVRYDAFEKALENKKGKIAVAHNSNDRAETMLFHLFRGTGLTGASGIRPVNGKIIRPLLCLRRSEIEQWLETEGYSFCQDSTNAQDFYTRNRIRHHILPYAEQEICQGAVANMSRAADQLLSAEEYIARQTKAAMERCVQVEDEGETVIIKIPELLKEDTYLRGRILMESVAMAAGRKKDITAAHIHSMESLFRGEGSKELHLPYGITVYKKYELGMIQRKDKKIGLNKAECEISIPISLYIENRVGEGALRLSAVRVPGLGMVEFTVFSRKDSQNIPEKTYTKWFDYDKIETSFSIRRWKTGDYLTIDQEMNHKSFRRYMIETKIPVPRRNSVWLFAEGSHVMWVPGGRMSTYYKVTQQTKTILQIQICTEE